MGRFGHHYNSCRVHVTKWSMAGFDQKTAAGFIGKPDNHCQLINSNYRRRILPRTSDCRSPYPRYIRFTVIRLIITYTFSQDWYTEVSTNRSSLDENIVCMENTVIFSISSFQYLILALAFSQGPPYRTRIWKNLPFLVSLLMLGSVTTMLIITPTAWMVRGFEMAIYNSDWTDNVVTEAQSVPLWYRWLIMGLVVAQFSFSIFVEDVLIKSESVRKIFKIVRQKRMPKNKYKRIEMEIQSRSAWMGAITIPQTDDSTESNSIKNRADRRTSNYTLE